MSTTHISTRPLLKRSAPTDENSAPAALVPKELKKHIDVTATHKQQAGKDGDAKKTGKIPTTRTRRSALTTVEENSNVQRETGKEAKTSKPRTTATGRVRISASKSSKLPTATTKVTRTTVHARTTSSISMRTRRGRVCEEEETDVVACAEPEPVDQDAELMEVDEEKAVEEGTAAVGETVEEEEIAGVEEDGFVEEIDYLDTTMVGEYSKEIFQYLRELELKYMPDPNYMQRQTEIEWSMRGILVDWLVQVHGRFHLLPETLFLCINIIDRFLSVKVVALQKLQLVGAAALFIAAKVEEIQCPSVSEIVYMVDNGYTAEEVLKAERFMLNQLRFELGWPGPYSFLRRISKADEYDLQTRTLAKYLIEVTLMDERFLPYPTSLLAAAGHYLARSMLNKGDWTRAHQYYSGYTEEEIQPVVRLTVELLRHPKKHAAIFEKYADKRFMKASIFVSQYLGTRR
ncbi:uncharacterized protein VTP21DRAFT_10885 [Calcarisporiella thermophila]|uniref:uncharacterized protein n=1 Tax=Calcarisporiella thermophila TaxID=911321 RepID=UPI0037445661